MSRERSNRLVRSGKQDIAPSIKLSIGALSNATGIPAETLRTWEARYGFPVPLRKPSGHRLYEPTTIARLHKILRVLDLGYRPAEVVGAPDDQLDRILDARPTPVGHPAESAADLDAQLAMVKQFDALGLTTHLLRAWAHAKPLTFLQDCLTPLLVEVGNAWEDGRLTVAHEHFVSERIEDVLKSLRLPFDERARGPIIALATLPGEKHVLGLQMAAMVAASSGWAVRCFGAELPLEDMPNLVRELRAHALGLSISKGARTKRVRSDVLRIRQHLPSKVALVVGGAGAPEFGVTSRIHRAGDLRSFAAWLGAQRSAAGYGMREQAPR